jgi:uncharacterized protein (DUF924 family)
VTPALTAGTGRDDAFDAEVRGAFLPVAARGSRRIIVMGTKRRRRAGARHRARPVSPQPVPRRHQDLCQRPSRARWRSRAVDRGADARIDPVLREFLYLPFMHSEHLADQLRCIELSREAGLAESAKWAEHHADIIRRFGRFPHATAFWAVRHAGGAGLPGRRGLFALMTEA